MTLAVVSTSLPRHTIQQESDVYHIAQIAKSLAVDMGFSEYDCGMLASAVSEITMNVVRHAGHGWAVVKRTDNNKGIDVYIEDAGSGIDDLSKAFTIGFSTFGSFGLGLGAANRSVDELIVNKNDATGLSITLRHYLPISPDDIDVAAISFSAIDENTNGDAYIVQEYEGENLLVAVIDGAGKGEKAAVSAKMAVNTIKKHYKLPLDQIITVCDKAIRQSFCERPAEICLLRLTIDTVEFSAIGNIAVYSQTKSNISFLAQNGSAGMLLPEPIQIIQHQRPDDFIFILHSDGVSREGISSLVQKDESAYMNAQLIFDNNASSHDDATVIVIKG